jgi:succinoglycan biosynthesis transport protein ExoP
MSFIQIIRLLVRFAPYILISAFIMTGVTYLMTMNSKKEYKSHTLLNTGLISGYNIESNKGDRIDYAFTNNEMENLINIASSFETNKELSARILADLMLAQANGKKVLLVDNLPEWYKLLEEIPLKIEKTDDPELVYQQIISIAEADKENSIYKLMHSKNPFMGLEQLENLKVSREGGSDMIRIEYASIDPYLSQQMLSLLTNIFIFKQQSIKEGQTDSVINFFEEATQKTLSRLQGAEDELLKFRVSNQIINYYEQTRFIAGNREELEKEYQEQLRIKAAAESALARVNLEIKDKRVLSSLQNQIAVNQGKLADYNFALMELDLINDKQKEDPNQSLRQELQGKISSLRAEVMGATYAVVDVSQTSDGLPTQNLLSQWLSSVITKEESTAKIQVMDHRMKEYDQIYDRFAPLGSTLKRLESEIDVAEREYLENLHSFNQARLHKYNMEMSSNLKVIDKPFYPAQAEKSKALMMLVLSFIVGLVIPSGVLIGAEIMDGSLKCPKNAKEQTGLSVAGLLPLYPKKKEKSPVDFDTLDRQAMNLFLQELKVASRAVEGRSIISVCSIHPLEGKSTIIEKIEAFIAEYCPSDLDSFEFREIPSLLNNPYANDKFQEAHIHLLACRADRKWTEADQHALKVYKKFVGKKPLLLLNGVRTDIMEDVTGEVPRTRSWVRAKMKSLLS